MELINVETKELLDELYGDSAFTIEGLSSESYTDLVNWIKQYTKLKEKLYIISGKTMNNMYCLTGNNQYQDDCNIVCIKLSDMENALALVTPRFNIGGRWFDDVVDNNRRREE